MTIINTKCSACEIVFVNGVATHEHGCPRSWINPITDKPYPRSCRECGSYFAPESRSQYFCNGCTLRDQFYDYS